MTTLYITFYEVNRTIYYYGGNVRENDVIKGPADQRGSGNFI